jgi:CheY-like chemotaxis protein
VLARLLSKEGHQVEAAGSCAEALNAVRSQPAGEPFQALVCDLGLPDGSGLDIVRELKAVTPGLTAIALSGFGTDDDIRRSREAGFDEHLVKPASIQELRRALAT